jgi:hypothetical protein
MSGQGESPAQLLLHLQIIKAEDVRCSMSSKRSVMCGYARLKENQSPRVAPS